MRHMRRALEPLPSDRPPLALGLVRMRLDVQPVDQLVRIGVDIAPGRSVLAARTMHQGRVIRRLARNAHRVRDAGDSAAGMAEEDKGPEEQFAEEAEGPGARQDEGEGAHGGRDGGEAWGAVEDEAGEAERGARCGAVGGEEVDGGEDAAVGEEVQVDGGVWGWEGGLEGVDGGGEARVLRVGGGVHEEVVGGAEDEDDSG